MKPITMLHGEPYLKWAEAEVSTMNSIEILQHAIVEKFSYGWPELEELRTIIPENKRDEEEVTDAIGKKDEQGETDAQSSTGIIVGEGGANSTETTGAANNKLELMIDEYSLRAIIINGGCVLTVVLAFRSSTLGK